MKLSWQTFRDRLKKTGRSTADLVRATGIVYPRLSGFKNGYWNLREDEMSKVESALKEWESAKSCAKSAGDKDLPSGGK